MEEEGDMEGMVGVNVVHCADYFDYVDFAKSTKNANNSNGRDIANNTIATPSTDGADSANETENAIMRTKTAWTEKTNRTTQNMWTIQITLWHRQQRRCGRRVLCKLRHPRGLRGLHDVNVWCRCRR